MKKILFVALLAGIVLVFQNILIDKVAFKVTGVTRKKTECAVAGFQCGELVRLLNSLRPGNYYETVERLFKVSLEDNTLARNDNAMIFTLPEGDKLIHYQGRGKEMGYVTIIFADKRQVRLDPKGNIVTKE